MIRGPGDGPTGRALVLRAPTLNDRERWLQLMNDTDELRFGVPAFVERPEDVEGLTAVVESAAERFAISEPGAMTVVDVARPEHLLGTVSWRWDAHPALRVADVGYGVHPDSRRQGVGRDALRLLARWLLVDDDGPRLARVQLDHSVENPASCRVALGAGFEQEGVRRGFLPLRDDEAPDGVRRHDVCLHGRTTGDV